ncbi:MAG: helix-turn-helix transcriptional regulator [Pseudobutyrivibrio sp.]|nr:helix-turn-helix transcriptional regulator [Pseudobutyrivibrio sp.]
MKARYEEGTISAEAAIARQDVASKMKDMRLSMNLTQQDLADRSGTQKSNISRMESGKYNPSLDFLVKVADSMGKHVLVKFE